MLLVDDEEELAQKSDLTSDEIQREEASVAECQPAPTREGITEEGEEEGGEEGEEIHGNTTEQFVNRLFMQRFRTMDMSRWVIVSSQNEGRTSMGGGSFLGKTDSHYRAYYLPRQLSRLEKLRHLCVCVCVCQCVNTLMTEP